MSRPRSLPPVPRLVGRPPEDYVRELQNFLERLDDYAVVTTHSDDDPTEIQAGVAADPGTINVGLSSGDHVHPIDTGAPTVPIRLNTSASEGTTTALLRAGAQFDTTLLQSDVQALIDAATSDMEAMAFFLRGI